MKTLDEIALTIYQPIGMTSNEFAYALAKEYAKEAIKADREHLLNYARAKEDPADYGTGKIWVDKDSILKAPNIELL